MNETFLKGQSVAYTTVYFKKKSEMGKRLCFPYNLTF